MQVNLVNTMAIVGVEALTLFIKKAVPQTVIKAKRNLSKVNNLTLNLTQVFNTMSIVGLDRYFDTLHKKGCFTDVHKG